MTQKDVDAVSALVASAFTHCRASADYLLEELEKLRGQGVDVARALGRANFLVVEYHCQNGSCDATFCGGANKVEEAKGDIAGYFLLLNKEQFDGEIAPFLKSLDAKLWLMKPGEKTELNFSGDRIVIEMKGARDALSFIMPGEYLEGGESCA